MQFTLHIHHICCVGRRLDNYSTDNMILENVRGEKNTRQWYYYGAEEYRDRRTTALMRFAAGQLETAFKCALKCIKWINTIDSRTSIRVYMYQLHVYTQTRTIFHCNHGLETTILGKLHLRCVAYGKMHLTPTERCGRTCAFIFPRMYISHRDLNRPELFSALNSCLH